MGVEIYYLSPTVTQLTLFKNTVMDQGPNSCNVNRVLC